MKEIWTKEKPEYHGDIIDFPQMMTGPKPVQKPHPPIIVGGAFRYAARFVMPTASSRKPRASGPARRRNFSRGFGRWRKKPAVIQSRYR
jgi:alkanesulfonate monooxygenase SsuD/methylene tetrahydromethanopterin reductase-like flavin-dependent oxidoreductase (luciferase family)